MALLSDICSLHTDSFNEISEKFSSPEDLGYKNLKLSHKHYWNDPQGHKRDWKVSKSAKRPFLQVDGNSQTVFNCPSNMRTKVH